MFRFFRAIRSKLLSSGKISNYLAYAVGEIILVVIGILIALQINNLNNDWKDRRKEAAYLKEIRSNLVQDSISLQGVITFNKMKSQVVKNLMSIYADTMSNQERFQIFTDNSHKFVNYDMFVPVNTGFSNLLSAESIDLIRDDSLKIQLTDYYNYDFEGGIQERIIQMNRKVSDNYYYRFMTREYVQQLVNISTEFDSVEDLDIHKDRSLFSELYGIQYIIRLQDNLMRITLEKNALLRKSIGFRIDHTK